MDHPSTQPSPRKKNGARLLIVVAAVLWSTSSFFSQAPHFDDWPLLEGSIPVRGTVMAFWRALFAGLVLVPFVRRPVFTWRLVPMLLIFLAMNVTYLAAMVLTTPANAIWLQYTAPVWVFLAGAFWLRETIVPRDWLLLVFVSLGVGTILLFEIRGQAMAGVVYGLLAGLTFAGVVLSLRQLREYDATWLVALNLLVTAAALSPFVVYQGIWPSAEQYPYLVGFGALQMGIPYVLFARGIRTVPSHEASTIALLEPLLVPVWVYLVWSKPTDWWTLAGGAMIFVGLLLRYAWRRGE